MASVRDALRAVCKIVPVEQVMLDPNAPSHLAAFNFGGTAPVKLTMDDKTGFEDEWETCPECGGDGEVLDFKPRHDDPEFCIVRQCHTCGGSGWICK